MPELPAKPGEGVASGRAAALVQMRSVGKRFANGTLALSGLDLDVFEGEFLTLLGPSGCGKTTVLRLLAGLASPSTGKIAWRNQHKPEIGFVFQEPTLMPWADVFDNVWLPLRLRGLSRAQAKADIEEMLELVGLAPCARYYPRELSGGMKMRVSLARALILRPALLLMDEPFAALDEVTRFKLNNDLLAMKARLGTSIVFVTHSVYESAYLATRIAIMAAQPGRIVSVLDVREPLQRDTDFRHSAVYSERCRQASRALDAAMPAGAEP